MLGFGIRESTTTTGTGNLTIAAETGYPRFSDAFPYTSARRFYYSILDANNLPIESGIGYLTTNSNTLVREKVLATYVSSVYDNTAPTAATLGAGTKYVICTSADTGTFGGYLPYSPSGANGVSPGYQSSEINKGLTATDAIDFYPIPVLARVECTGLYVNLSIGATAGKVFRMGLYQVRSDGRPGKILMDSGNIAADTTGAKNFTLGTNVILNPGFYYFAMASDGAPSFTGNYMTCSGWLGYNTSSPARPIGRAYIGSTTYGAFADDPAGTLVPVQAVDIPYIWIKAT